MVSAMQSRETASSRLLGAPGLALAFVWAFAEGTLFFIVPDVLITLAAVLRPRRALAHVAMALAGALLAGAVMFLWAARSPEAARSTVAAVPFVGERMLQQVQEELDVRGPMALLRGGFSGTPYKIYAVEAPGRVSFAALLLATAVARALRFLVAWAIAAIAARVLGRIGVRRPAHLAAIHAALWSAFYAYYWSAV